MTFSSVQLSCLSHNHNFQQSGKRTCTNCSVICLQSIVCCAGQRLAFQTTEWRQFRKRHSQTDDSSHQGPMAGSNSQGTDSSSWQDHVRLHQRHGPAVLTIARSHKPHSHQRHSVRDSQDLCCRQCSSQQQLKYSGVWSWVQSFPLKIARTFAAVATQDNMQGSQQRHLVIC